MDTKEFIVFVPTLFMDISSTPGAVFYEIRDGYLSREDCEMEVRRLNMELEGELRAGDDENADDSGDVEYDGYSLSSAPSWCIHPIKVKGNTFSPNIKVRG